MKPTIERQPIKPQKLKPIRKNLKREVEKYKSECSCLPVEDGKVLGLSKARVQLIKDITIAIGMGILEIISIRYGHLKFLGFLTRLIKK